MVYGGGVGDLETKNELPLVARFDLLVFCGCWGGGIGGYGLLWFTMGYCGLLCISAFFYFALWGIAVIRRCGGWFDRRG